MDINEDFNEIVSYTHVWHWCSDWDILQKIYNIFPESYSVLTPFAYSYLEEAIRSTTSEYGIEILDKNGNPKRRKVGLALIQLAQQENNDNIVYVKLLDELKRYFKESSSSDNGNNRNSVIHGYMHPINWKKESFENLIHDIARLSPYVGF